MSALRMAITDAIVHSAAFGAAALETIRPYTVETMAADHMRILAELQRRNSRGQAKVTALTQKHRSLFRFLFRLHNRFPSSTAGKGGSEPKQDFPISRAAALPAAQGTP